MGNGVSYGGRNRDNWGGFRKERIALANFFRDNGIRNLFILSGDAHMVGIDDGSNHDFSTVPAQILIDIRSFRPRH